MPSFNSKAITEEYLLSIHSAKLFSLKVSEIKLGFLIKKKTVSELLDLLTNLSSKPIGMDISHLPDKQWLVNAI